MSRSRAARRSTGSTSPTSRHCSGRGATSRSRATPAGARVRPAAARREPPREPPPPPGTRSGGGRAFGVGSHDGRIVARALELAKDHATPFEFAMLKGVRDPLKADLVAQGHRVTEYIPYGPSWLPYFTRRLRERPRNVVTMLRSLVSGWGRNPFLPRGP